MSAPVFVSRLSLDARARPKSITLTRSPPASSETMTLSGLMSRWTTPRAWLYSRASAIWMAMSTTSPSAERRRRNWCRLVPCTSGITKKSDPS